MLRRPAECFGCELNEKAMGFSEPEGHGTLGLLCFGEALGENEARDGLPFRQYAQAGSLLERVIRMCGLDRQQLRLYNMVNCRPPRDWLNGAPWELAAVNHCAVHRNRIVEEMQPRAILALGAIPLRYLTGQAGKKRNISYLRGYVLPSLDWGGLPVIPTFHPSYIKRGQQDLINVMAHDIRKAVAIAQGKFTNFCLFPEREAWLHVNYITEPTVEDARSYLRRARENPQAILAFDIETGESAFKAEDEDEEIQLEIDAGEITQIQFSLGPKEAIAFPWQAEFKEIAADLLALPNVKAGHNAWRFDLPVLRREGVRVAGIVHDTRWMWKQLQPDLPAELQFVGSFYGMPFAWKHMASYNDAFYGCADADVLSRIMALLPKQLEAKDCWRGYERHMMGIEPLLLGMSAHGIPVDDTIRMEFDAKLAMKKDRAGIEAQAYWPQELVRYHPAKGYMRPPADKTGLIQKEFPELVSEGQDALVEDAGPPLRWCKPLPFNPNSPAQVLEYIKRRKYPVPTKYRSDAETSEEIELLKLGKKYHDPIFDKIVEYREYDTMRGTFVAGWQPGEDGFVHPSYNFGTAVHQLASKKPNGQNFPRRSDLAKEMRRMIRAKSGHKLVEVDFSAFHAVMLAFEAKSANWLRLARSDIHSFTTAHFLHLPERDKLLGWPDEELKEYLARIKGKYSVIRDNKSKHAILGVGNGLGYRKLYRQYSDYFDGEKEAKTLLDTIRGIFPEVFQYQDRRRREAHEKTYLVNSYWGYLRWLFDVLHFDWKSRSMIPGEDSEKAVSFNHVTDAFGHKKEQMLWLHASGNDRRWGYMNDIHDSFMFHCPEALVEECAAQCHAQMTKRSPVLVNEMCPTGLWVDVEIKVGTDWASMHKLKMPAALGLIYGGAEGLAQAAPARLEWDIPAVECAEVAVVPF